jgi:hypothetical protein
MSNPYLPPEILDCIVDLLINEPQTLRNCCLVARSWLPRTRMHLFRKVGFRTSADLDAWKEAFPDPASSPAYYAHRLYISYAGFNIYADGEEGGWIRAFCNVVRLDVWWPGTENPHFRFQPRSPVPKSLPIAFVTPSFSQIFKLICSLPLLEDLKMVGSRPCDTDDLNNFQPPTSPPLTGSLSLFLPRGTGHVIRRLLELPNGIHFREFKGRWFQDEGNQLMTTLVETCSDTLERVEFSFDSTYLPLQRWYQHLTRNSAHPARSASSTDLRKATKLKAATFRPYETDIEWITTALKTITAEHIDFKQVSIHIRCHYIPLDDPDDFRQTVGEAAYGKWMDLDRILVRLWESHSVHTMVYNVREKGELCVLIGCLLPEVTKKGAIEVVNRRGFQ